MIHYFRKVCKEKHQSVSDAQESIQISEEKLCCPTIRCDTAGNEVQWMHCLNPPTLYKEKKESVVQWEWNNSRHSEKSSRPAGSDEKRRPGNKGHGTISRGGQSQATDSHQCCLLSLELKDEQTTRTLARTQAAIRPLLGIYGKYFHPSHVNNEQSRQARRWGAVVLQVWLGCFHRLSADLHFSAQPVAESLTATRPHGMEAAKWHRAIQTRRGTGARSTYLPGSGQRRQGGQSGQASAGDGVVDQQQDRQRDQHGRVDDNSPADEAKDKQQHAPGAHGPQWSRPSASAGGGTGRAGGAAGMEWGGWSSQSGDAGIWGTSVVASSRRKKEMVDSVGQSCSGHQVLPASSFNKH